MWEVDEKWLVLIFRLLEKEEAAETFSYMDSDQREILINALTDSELEEVMEEMYLDDTVDVLEEMPANVVDRLLMATDEEKRKQINQLLQYPEDSAGSIMNADYIALSQDMTVEDAILKIRQVGLNSRDDLYLLCNRKEEVDRRGGYQGSSDYRRSQTDRGNHGHEYAVCKNNR